MRDIKFRIYDKKKKRFTNYKIYDDMLYGMDKNTGVWIRIKDNSRFELMQYTELHDKNGKEIYEGDIVKITGSKEIDIGKVIYEYNEFTVDVMNMDRFYGRVHPLEKFTEVIGNIYDNPELLGGE